MGRFVPRAVLAFAVIFLLAVGVGPWTGKYRTVTVLTASMKPGMPPGSMAVLVPVDPSAIRVGDVITFQAPIRVQPVVTHRVIAIVEPGSHPVIRTQGDANDSPDPWTARISDSTAWRRVAVIPVIGTLIHSLRSPLVHQATVYVVPGLLAIAWLIGIWSRDSKTNRTRPASAALAASVAGTPTPMTGRLWRAAWVVVAVVVLTASSAMAAFNSSVGATATYSTATLAAPTNLSSSAGTCVVAVGPSVVLTWTSSSSTWADGYEVLRSLLAGGPYTSVALVVRPEHHDLHR